MLFDHGQFTSLSLHFLMCQNSGKFVMSITWDRIYKAHSTGTPLVAQWLRIHLPMQGTWVRALVREDPTYHGATKPVSYNY